MIWSDESNFLDNICPHDENMYNNPLSFLDH